MIFRNRESRLKKQAGFLCKEADLFSRIPHFSEHPIRDHPGDPHGSRSIDAVDDHAHLHPFVPDVSRRIGEHGKDSGKDHKRGIAVDNDLRRRGLQRPVKGAQGQDRPRDKQHKSGNGSTDFIFHIHDFLSYYYFSDLFPFSSSKADAGNGQRGGGDQNGGGQPWQPVDPGVIHPFCGFPVLYHQQVKWVAHWVGEPDFCIDDQHGRHDGGKSDPYGKDRGLDQAGDHPENCRHGDGAGVNAQCVPADIERVQDEIIILYPGDKHGTEVICTDCHEHLGRCQQDEHGEFGEAQLCGTHRQGQHFHDAAVRAFGLDEEYRTDDQ